MNLPVLIKYIVDRWNDDEDIVELLGELNGETTIDEDVKLPYARCAIEIIESENLTGSSFLNQCILLIVIYGLQNAGEHYQASKLINKLLLGKNCRFDVPDEGIHVLSILPNTQKFENIDTLAGRDILVSEHNIKMLIQSTNLSPD